MKSTTSKAETAPGAAKKGLLRKLGGRVRRIFKREKNSPYQLQNETLLQGSFNTSALPTVSNEHIPIPNAPTKEHAATSSSDKTACEAQAERTPSLAGEHVAREEKSVISYGSPLPQARVPTTAALVGLLAQAARILAEGLHDVKHQPRNSSKSSSNQTPCRNVKHSQRPPALNPLQDNDGIENTLVNDTHVHPSPKSPTFDDRAQIADEYQQLSLASNQAWVDQFKTEAGAADEADWVALTNWLKRWCQDEAAEAVRYQEEALEHRADAAKRQAEVVEMRITVLATEAANHNNMSEIEDDRDHLQRLFDELQERTDSFGLDWMQQKAELERSLRVEKQQRAKNFRDATKAKGEKKALGQQLAEQKKEAERELQDRQETIDSLLLITQTLSQQLAELKSMNSAVNVICDLRSEIQRLQTNNQSAEIQVQALLDNLTNIRKQLANAEENASRAEAERKAAVLEVGMVHLQNMIYRAEFEDGDPARTAEIDGRLKRKDEAFENLQELHNKAVTLLNGERQVRAFDREHFVGQKQVLEDEKVVLKKSLKSVTMHRDNIQQQNEEVFAMFKAKIFYDDVAKALAKDSEILREDNVRLITMSKKRECRLQKVIEETVTLKQKIAELEGATEGMTEKQRHLQAETNGLELHKSKLEHAADIETAVWEQERARLNDQISLRDKEIQRLIQDCCETSTWEELQTKEAEIANLKKNLQQERSLAAQYFDQIQENRTGFCYVHDYDEIWNENAADVRYRLRIAERENVRLQKLLDGQNGGQRGQEERYIPLTEGEGAYYGSRLVDKSSDDTITF